MKSIRSRQARKRVEVLAGLVAYSAIAARASGASASDGVLEINQACAVQTGCFTGDEAGFPVTINEPGSYQLTSNLSVSNLGEPARPGIVIDADNVTAPPRTAA